MKFVGLVMAGGRGTRLGGVVEKPLLCINKKPMIMYVIEALKRAPSVSNIYVAVSPHTPRTKNFVLSTGAVSVIDTPGLGYHNDMRLAIKKVGVGCFLVVSADLPMLNSRIIEEVVSAYGRIGKPSLTVIAPLRLFEKIGLSPSWTLDLGGVKFVPCGINLVEGAEIDEPYIEEGYFVVEDPSVCVNVNTFHDLSIAERLILQDG
ncbi:MAG: NTP transferase domain-containing protein [Candidatus Methanomethylicaceae archaeon]